MSQASEAPQQVIDYGSFPDASGHFGVYGGQFVPETLMAPLRELGEAYARYRVDPDFQAEFERDCRDFVGRPSPLYLAERWSNQVGGARIYLKREDLDHTGAHKINNTVGQALLARRMGKKRIIAETGAGQHGVATATVCAKFGMSCTVYMGAEDMERQKLNVERMKLLGAEVLPVTSGSQTLKDATNEAIRDWVTNVENTYYIIGSVVGPHPYPMLVRDFQCVIGEETRDQVLEHEGKVPDYLVACLGGGSNAIGIFHPFINDESVRLIGLEAAGEGVDTGKTAATLTNGTHGVLHGSLSYLLQNFDGQIQLAYSISAGLDYPGTETEHAHLHDIKRVEYYAIDDKRAMEGVKLASEMEGIIPALETAHAFAYLNDLMPKTDPDEVVVVNCSGRGDKDMATIAKHR